MINLDLADDQDKETVMAEQTAWVCRTDGAEYSAQSFFANLICIFYYYRSTFKSF